MSLRYRPLALTGFTLFLVLFLSLLVDERISLVCIAGGTLVFICSVLFKKIRKSVFPFFLAAALVAGGMLFTIENDYSLKYAQSFVSDEPTIISGTVTDYATYSDSRYYYLIRIDSINGKAVETNLRLSIPNDVYAEPYDRIKTEATVYLIGKSAGEDIERYFHSKGVYLGAYCNSNGEDAAVSVQKTDNKPLRYQILKLRKAIETRILDKLPNEYGGTAVALLLGDKSFISDETKSELYEAGIAPVFAVSGLHLSIWVMGLYSVLKGIEIRKRTNSLICIGFTVFFMALTGFSPSVCRSGLMMLLFLSGNLFYRKTDSLNSLGFAVLILCIINPFIVEDTGFLMSFTATLAIVSVMPFAEKKIIGKISTGLIKAAVTSVIVSLCAIVGSLPVTVFFIGYISIFTVITNLLITYAATLCMVFAGITSILFRVEFISDMTAFISGILAKYILFIVRSVNAFPVTSISTSDIFWQSGIIISLFVLAFSLFFLKNKTALRFACAGVAITIVTASTCSYFYYNGLTDVNLLDVGDGIAVVVTANGRKILLKSETKSYNSIYTIEDELNRRTRKDGNLMLIADGDAAEDFSTLYLLKNYGFIKTALPLKSDSVEQVTDKNSLIVSACSTLNVWENGIISFNCDEKASYAYCEFDGNTFFVLFKARRGAVIPEKYLSADFLVCNGYLPEYIDLSEFRAVFVSSAKKKSDSIKSYVTENGGRAFDISKYGGINVRIKNNNYKIDV
ncbi:MAG: ComEC family competence protein [Clostridia bacterium]|nr:ComEC family competence protein [Clostridia bacterium]